MFTFIWKIIKFLALCCCLYVKLVVGFIVISLSLLVFLVVIGTLVIDSSSEFSENTDKILFIKPSNILTDHKITSDTQDTLLSIYGIDTPYSYTSDILDLLNQAENDTKVKSIVLDLRNLSDTSYGISTYLGNKIKQFSQKTGKKVYAYSSYYTQPVYLLASYADEIVLDPTGDVDIHGIKLGHIYFADLLKSLNLEPIVIKKGKYKSAVEPFFRDSMSDEARENYTTMSTKIWDQLTHQIAENRSIDVDSLLPKFETKYKELLSSGYNDAIYSLNKKFVDRIESYETFIDNLKKSYPSATEENKLNILVNNEYKNENYSNSTNKNKKVAVVYLSGEITPHSDSNYYINYANYAKVFEKIENNKDIFAVVLRINSPGGSASEAIKLNNAIQHLRSTGRKVVISMGESAASGGYLISAQSDYIFAEPTTLTGSIGVFGVIPNLNKFSKEIGVNYDEVSNNDSEYRSIFEPFTENHQKVIEGSIDGTYLEFLEIVSKGRNKTKDEIHEIAQGRVWSGIEALQVGLIDELGDTEKAINKAAELANVSNFSIDYSIGNSTKNFSNMFYESLAIKLTKFNVKIPEELLPALKIFNTKDSLSPFNDKKSSIYMYQPIKIK